MRRRIIKIILPILLVALAGNFIIILGLSTLESVYYTHVNREFYAAIGAMIDSDSPDSDPIRLIQELRSPSPEAARRGQHLLESYGYTAQDLVSSSTQNYIAQVRYLLTMSIFTIALLLTIYFLWRDHRTTKQIRDLVVYLQDLNNKVYDLRLAENDENELSFLTNELYKIMVMLREAADQNQKSRQELETALADISHQLRTPLTSLRIMVDNIYDDPEMPSDVRQDFLREISRQTESMSSLVTTLLHLAKFDSKSIKLHRENVVVGDLLVAVKQNLAVLADISDVEILVAGDLTAQAKLDQRWQTEAITNIVKNCIEHSSAGSTVQIDVINNPLFLKIKIRDHGEGISPDDLKHIFERFYKARTLKENSVGIGLSLAKTVIESDHGQIAVRSRPGEGTEFTITYFH